MPAFQLDLKIKNFEKLTQLPKIIESSVKKWEVLDSKMKAIDTATAGIVKNLKLHEASAIRIALVQQKANLAKFFEMAKNPMALVSKGFTTLILKAGLLMKALGIGLIISALTAVSFLVGFILKTLFKFNVGGIGTQFARVGAIISATVNKAIINMVKLVKQLDPILKPLFKFWADSIIVIVKNIGSFTTGIGKSTKIAGLLKNYFVAYGNLLKLVFDISKQLWSSFSDTGSATQGMMKALSGYLEIMIKVSTTTIKFITLIYRILSALGVFKAIGITLKLVFDVIGYSLEKILDVINWIIDGVNKIMDLYSAFTGRALEATGAGNTSNVDQRSSTNNVTFVSPTPITGESADLISNRLVSTIKEGGYK